MNILTSSGLAARWLGDWAGDRAVFRNLRIGLGASNHPGDTMTMAGSVTDVGEGGAITVAFVGTNSLGNHIHGSAELTLPEGPQGAGGSA